MHLTENFSLKELTSSQTAERHGIGWHKLTEGQYKKSLEHYNKNTPKAIDGVGE